MGLVDLYRTWAQIQEQNRLRGQQDAGSNWLKNYESAATPQERELRFSQLPNVIQDPATAEQFERRALTRDQLRMQGDQSAKAKQLEDFMMKAADFYTPSQATATRGQMPTSTEARQDLLAFGRDQGVSPLVIDQAAKGLESFLRPKTKFENVGGTLYGLNEESGTVGIPEGFQVPQIDPLKDMPADYRAFLVSNQAQPSPEAYAAFNAGEMARRRAGAVNVNVGEKAPQGYRWAQGGDLEAIPGGPAVKSTAEAAAKEQLLIGGLQNVKEFKAMLIPDGETVNRELLFGLSTRAPFTQGREAYTLIYDAIEAKLRAESGAAVPEPEVQRMAKRFVPSMLDNDQTIKTKLQKMEEFLKGAGEKTREGRGGVKSKPIDQMTDEEVLNALGGK